MAVVRLELTTPFPPPRANVLPALLPAATGAAALQIDHDVAEGNHYWYYRLIADLRKALPPGKPLSVAVRPSWCSAGSWVAGLPVAEACPLRFRDPADPVLEICRSSAGVWTGDPRPRVKRLYWFHPLPWTPEAFALTQGSRR